MAGINVTVVGISSLTKAFDKLSGMDVNALLGNVEAVIDADLMQRFQKGQAPDGTKWIASQRALNEGGKTLVDKANLRDSFHGVITDEQLNYGSDEKYAAIHQFGGKTGRNLKVTLPARPMLGLSSTQLGLVENAVTDFMEILLP